MSRGGFPFVMDQFGHTGKYLVSPPSTSHTTANIALARNFNENVTINTSTIANSTTSEDRRKLQANNVLSRSPQAPSLRHDLHRQSVLPSEKHVLLQHVHHSQQQQQQQSVVADITNKHQSSISHQRIVIRSPTPTPLAAVSQQSENPTTTISAYGQYSFKYEKLYHTSYTNKNKDH